MSKGKVAEREVAAIIKQWWSTVEPKADFVRTPMSGGWGKTREVRAGFKASGDLMTTASRFPFTIEVKRRESWTLSRLVEGRPSPVWQWWRQAQTQGEEMELVPLLWIRRNREPWRIIMPLGFAMEKRLKFFSWTRSESVIQHGTTRTGDLSECDYGEQVPAMMMASEFLALSPRHFAL